MLHTTSDKPWSSDFTAQNLAKYSTFNLVPSLVNDVKNLNNSIVHFHNIQILAKRFRLIAFMNNLKKNSLVSYASSCDK